MLSPAEWHCPAVPQSTTCLHTCAHVCMCVQVQSCQCVCMYCTSSPGYASYKNSCQRLTGIPAARGSLCFAANSVLWVKRWPKGLPTGSLGSPYRAPYCRNPAPVAAAKRKLFGHSPHGVRESTAELSTRSAQLCPHPREPFLQFKPQPTLFPELEPVPGIKGPETTPGCRAFARLTQDV